MKLTRRQAVLLDRLHELTERADQFPCPIVEIWGGGSLFRLEASPKDADCVFRYAGIHGHWHYFREAVEADAANPSAAIDWQELRRLAPKLQELIQWWCKAYHPICLSGLLGSIESMPSRLTERLIKKNFPRISVVELTPRSDPAGWRMTLTKIWETGASFDKMRAVGNAATLHDSDNEKLRQQLGEYREANRLMLESIREGCEAKYHRAKRCAGDSHTEPKENVPPAADLATTAELRKLVKLNTRRYDALRGAAQADSADPLKIAVRSLTSKLKIERWSDFLVEAGLLEPKHVALAKNRLACRYDDREIERFRLMTDLHDRGCIIQPHRGHYFFFADDVKGLLVGTGWSDAYANYSNGLLLTDLSDERPFHEWPVFRENAGEISEVWSLVQALSKGEAIESSPPLHLSCPFCRRNVVGRRNYFRLGYDIAPCPHLIDMEISWPNGGIAYGHLSEFNRLDELRQIDNDCAKSLRNQAADASAVGVFVRSEEFKLPALEKYEAAEDLSDNKRYQALCRKHLRNLQSGTPSQ